MNKTEIKVRNLIFPLSLITISIILLYWRMLDNFFYQDDFNWLVRVRNFGQKPLSLFEPAPHPGIPYISTLVYIAYWINYKISGLNPFTYHLLSLILHILNSYLVVYFVFLLCRNLLLATLTGLFFALSFAITDAVIWPAAYVDTIMFFFYILSLVTFIFFLEKRNRYTYVLSIICFTLSLFAKGTALPLPFSLFFIERYLCSSKIRPKQLFKYFPFLIIILVYFVLLNSGAHRMRLPDIQQVLLNAFKIPLTLLIPESLLPLSFWPVFVCFFLLSVLVLLFLRKRDSRGIGHLGLMLMFAGILPLFVNSWAFPVSDNPFVLFNHSIRHRLYLGNLGFTMVVGSLFNYYSSLENKIKLKFAISLIFIVFIGFNLYWNQKIQSKWDKVTDDTRTSLTEFKEYAGKHPTLYNVYAINFPPNQGCSDAFFELFFMNKFNVGVWPTEIPRGIERDRIRFLLQINGHIYDSPDEAVKNALTPWDLFFVAQFYLFTGEKQKSKAEIVKASSSDSDERLHISTSITYLQLGNTGKAIEELNKVVSINRNNKEAYERLGIISFETGDFASAISSFEEVLRIDAKDFKTMENLAQLYEDKGDIYNSRMMWERALKYEDRELLRETIKAKLSRMK